MKKLKRILSGVAAIAMAASSFMGLTTAHAEGTASITLKLPKLEAPKSEVAAIAAKPSDKFAYGDMHAYAYQVLKQKEGDAEGFYSVTDGFSGFFSSAKTEVSSTKKIVSYVDGALHAYASVEDLQKALAVADGKQEDDYASYTTTDYITLTTTSFDSNYYEMGLLSALMTPATNVERVAGWLKKYASTHASSFGTGEKYDKAVNNDNLKFDGLNAGYWLVYTTDEPDGVSNLDTVLELKANDAATITIKAEFNELDKTVTNTNDSGQDDGTGKNTNASVGDTLEYTITFDVQDLSKYTTGMFKLTDTMQNQLLIDSFDITIKDGDTVLLNKTTMTSESVSRPVESITANSADFTIDFDFDELKEIVGSRKNVKVTVTYKAILLDTALVKNGNTATLEFSNDPKNTNSKKELTDKTDVFSFGVNVDKTFTDGSTNKTKPAQAKPATEPNPEDTDTYPDGAEDAKYIADKAAWDAWEAWEALYSQVKFKLYKGETKGTDSLGFDDNGVYNKNKKNTLLSIDENGNLKVYGLAPGKYILEEAQYPKGYTKAGDVTIEITETGNVLVVTSDSASSPATNVEKLDVTTTTTVKYTLNAAGLAAKDGGEELADEVSVADYAGLDSTKKAYYDAVTETTLSKSYVSFKIDNSTSEAPELPGTGGMGVWLFGIGGMLMLAGAAYIFTRKRGQA